VADIARRRPRRNTNLAGLLVLAVTGAVLVQASPPGSAPYLGERPVRFEPAHAAPFERVRGIGFDCGDDWGPDDLFGLELNVVAEPPTEDEGVSLIVRNVTTASGSTASATFTIPDTSPGEYFAYYLCARGRETRVFLAVPPGGMFLVDPLTPRQTAPPFGPAGPTNAGVPLALFLLAALVVAALWRIAHVQARRQRRPSNEKPT